MATINYYLQKKAEDLFIKYGSPERTYIEERVSSFRAKLRNYFGRSIDEVILFGSYKRDTILPRKYDPNSDIDVLVVFKREETEFTTETYRNRLRRFAQQEYSTSIVLKDHPSVVLEMSSISFDLVPCKIENSFLWKGYQIPDKDGSWMNTDPDDFNTTLTTANKQYGSIVKPIVRLLKRWNASQGYPYLPFELEKHIASMSFFRDNYQSGFIYAAKNLPKFSLPESQRRKVETLNGNIDWIELYLNRDNQDKAIEVVNRILGL